MCSLLKSIEIPAGAILTPSVDEASYIMSQVAKTAPGIWCSVTADAGNNWYLLGFDGELEGQKLQAIDHVHLNGDSALAAAVRRIQGPAGGVSSTTTTT